MKRKTLLMILLSSLLGACQESMLEERFSTKEIDIELSLPYRLFDGGNGAPMPLMFLSLITNIYKDPIGRILMNTLDEKNYTISLSRRDIPFYIMLFEFPSTIYYGPIDEANINNYEPTLFQEILHVYQCSVSKMDHCRLNLEVEAYMAQ